MRDVPSWDSYFMSMAFSAATRSKDPNTNVGAVLVKDRDPLITGYNGFAPGVQENKELWERPHKYDRVIHAELNAISRCAKRGVSTDGATLYVTHFPCKECAKAVIAAGIKTVVYGSTLQGFWEESSLLSLKLFNEANVEVRLANI